MTTSLGKTGIWQISAQLDPELAAEVEKLGYGTIWLGGSPPADLAIAEQLLDATRRITVATGIVNIWSAAPGPVAESFHRINAKHPGRFVLGIGAGHREMNDDYRKPYQALVDYLDVLDAAGVAQSQRVLAALGPKVLELARDRAAGAHPYLTTPGHTRHARAILGDTLLAPEQKVVVDTDPQRARETGRDIVGRYLQLANYTRNLERHGFTAEDVTPPGSDRLVDALALHGTPEQIARGIDAHLQAGADHVAVQVLGDPLPGYRALAAALR
ncbi:probable F420-dependent oxidoreductase, MSMEG_4141 family [Saccharopolyspora kobensis]|uniref:Probable F420-dependent oxidoreductase, MSMEG_4141 family n=1 Tax=Saccharopolyspora kobensis TaxID=146035 RepID=A0A1H6E673_9PSEU|nr:LLM class F420-dependent oxidoreductase [Saccharopolyspora kobensis]SEG93220.1 probable F420-dependent oxidoreductase, MSMEG_4141 family [Saccharopolyspora kobensis]SFD43589.1 probable F420-dependent oxidoreductase, MSMEG_4141 family [Saccharopolyspora kobensis]